MRRSALSSPVPGWKTGLAIVAAVLLVYLVHCLTLNYVVDDAYITFQYVKNFVHGQGLVYNPGERVEGYTNFLWTVLLSLCVWLAPAGADYLSIAQTLGVLSGGLTIALAFRFARVTHGQFDAFAVIAPVLLAANAPFAAWSTAGLETTLFALLISSASYCYLDPRAGALWAPALFALAAMTRAEGLLFFGIVFVHLAVTEFVSGKGVMSNRVMGWALVFCAIYAPYYVWRLNYYGYPLPNVFYAKVGSGLEQYLRGLRYVRQYLFSYGGILLMLPLPFLILRRREAWLQVLAPQVMLYSLYVVYVGGDGLAYHRFWVPIAPFACILAQEALRGAWTWARQSRFPVLAKSAGAGTGLLLCGAVVLSAAPSLGPVLSPETYRWREQQSGLSFPGNGMDHSFLNFDNYFIERQKLAAEWLDANALPNAVIAATPAGSIAYHSHLSVIDMLGLNDAHIAHFGRKGAGWSRAGHEKGDGAYVLSRSPDFILLGNVAVLPTPVGDREMAGKLVRTSEHEIWADPDFHRRYQRLTVELADQGIFRYFTFYKKRGVALKNSWAGTTAANPFPAGRAAAHPDADPAGLERGRIAR